MTDEELNARFAQMADAVGRIAEAASRGDQHLEEQMERGFQRVEAAQLRFQEQLGDIVRAFREKAEQQDRLLEQHEQELQELRQRQAESDQRFEILLQEIRFLNRRLEQQPPQDEDEP